MFACGAVPNECLVMLLSQQPTKMWIGRKGVSSPGVPTEYARLVKGAVAGFPIRDFSFVVSFRAVTDPPASVTTTASPSGLRP